MRFNVLRHHYEPHLVQETELDNDVGSEVRVEFPVTDGARAATEDPEAEGRREEARQRQGAVLRDKTLACAAGVREIQIKMNTGVEELAKARAECLLVKKAILIKKQELSVLLKEELRVLEVEALLQKKVSSLEAEQRWMGCANGMTSLACHLTDTPIFPAGDVSGVQLAKIDARLAMDKARVVVSRESSTKPYSGRSSSRQTGLCPRSGRLLSPCLSSCTRGPT